MCFPLPIFYHILFNVFIFRLPTACTRPANSCLRAVVFAISSTWNLFFHIFVFIVVDVVSHHWDPSSEMKECLPYWVKCCQQAAVSCQPHLGVASAKESCLSQGHVSFLEQPHEMTGYCQGNNACLLCPNSGQLWKDISAIGSPIARAHWGLCWDCTWLSFSVCPVLLLSSPSHEC